MKGVVVGGVTLNGKSLRLHGSDGVVFGIDGVGRVGNLVGVVEQQFDVVISQLIAKTDVIRDGGLTKLLGGLIKDQ